MTCLPMKCRTRIRVSSSDSLCDNWSTAARQGHTNALQWVIKAAEKGASDAQDELGVMYATGQGVRKDLGEGLKLFREAARQGHANSQFNLAVMYAKGEGVPQDDAESYAWLSVAATNGQENAKNVLPKVKADLTPDQLAAARKRATELTEQINANKAR